MTKFITLFILLFFTIQLTAQFSMGAEVGLNYGEAYYTNLPPFLEKDTETGTKPRLGGYVAFVPTYTFKKSSNFAITSPLQLSVEEHKDLGDFYFRRTYLRLIPQLDYSFKSFSIFAGPNVGVVLNEQGRNIKGKWNKTIQLLSKPIDFGFTGGCKYTWKQYYLSLSYYQGVVDISTISITAADGQPLGQETQKNRHFQLGIGYWFE